MPTTDLAYLAGDVPVLGPTGIAVTTLTTVSSQVLPADPVRHGILFHNPGATAKRVLPAGLSLGGGSGGILIYPQSDFALLDGDGENLWNVNAAWNAVTDNNADGSLTIFNFTDASSATPPMPLAGLNMRVPIASPNPGGPQGTLGTVSAQVIGANPVRRGILFQNPGTVIEAVCPGNLAAAIGAGSRVILPGAELRIAAKGRVRVNCAWNGIAQSGTTNSLTVLEFL